MSHGLGRYAAFGFMHGTRTRTVYRRGNGPAVIIMHEIPGLHPMVVRFADRVAEAGMTGYLPSFFGEPGQPVSAAYAFRSMASVICIRREFTVWRAGRSSPIVDWLRALARRAHEECGGRALARPDCASPEGLPWQ
ncbi:MAG: dienelactone hydrolase family protein [Beijerinckiaceae bacterium]|nr:dienelactone hydrolase family protein [Beijerinckiaceae bacterium]MCI0735501.1 dienelactone hydrolase family protein [Beijerinckiaceae bacterium]